MTTPLEGMPYQSKADVLKELTELKARTTRNYLWAIGGIGGVALFATVVIVVWGPEKDSTPMIVTVFGFAGTITASLFSLLRSSENSQVLSNLTVSINGRMNELLKEAKQTAKAEGIQEGLRAPVAIVASEPVPDTLVAGGELKVVKVIPAAEIPPK